MGFFGRSKSNANNSAENLTPTQPISCVVKSSLPQPQVACVDLEAEVAVPADLLFTLLADPNQHEHIFDAIEGASSRLLQEDGPRRKYELDYKAKWKFWRIGGVCENRLFMETDSDAGTVSFKLREPGFLKIYEGTWRITPKGRNALNLGSSAPSNTHQRIIQAPSLQQELSVPSEDLMPRPGLVATLLRQYSLAGVLASMTNPLSDFQRAVSGKLSAANMAAPKSITAHRITAPSFLVSEPSLDMHQEFEDAATQQDQQIREALPSSSIVRVEGLKMSPKVAPPYPLGGLLKVHAAGQVEEMIKGLLAAASELQDTVSNDETFFKESDSEGRSSSNDDVSSTYYSRSSRSLDVSAPLPCSSSSASLSDTPGQ